MKTFLPRLSAHGDNLFIIYSNVPQISFPHTFFLFFCFFSCVGSIAWHFYHFEDLMNIWFRKIVFLSLSAFIPFSIFCPPWCRFFLWFGNYPSSSFVRFILVVDSFFFFSFVCFHFKAFITCLSFSWTEISFWCIILEKKREEKKNTRAVEREEDWFRMYVS